MKVLIFTTLFPNKVQRCLGTFSLERAKELARLAEIQVIAPVPYFPPLRVFRRWYPFSQVPCCEVWSGIVVHHPRYVVFPKVGMALYGLSMFFSVLCRVRALRRRFDFDLIDAHFVYPDGFAAVLLGKMLHRPVVVTSHGTDLNLYPRFSLVRKLLIYTLSRADAVIAVCKALKDQALSLGASEDKSSVIPNGVQLSKF
ncbi:glycosyltransferase, partial [bacterium]|nr:glycosyltransferase [bacterium]